MGGRALALTHAPVSCCRLRRALSTSTSARAACSAARPSRSCRFWSSRAAMVRWVSSRSAASLPCNWS